MTTLSHARRIVSALDPKDRALLQARPLAALQNLGFTVAAVSTPTETRGGLGSCDGLSFSAGQTIVYRSTPDNRRENFTLLHEYAHFLVSVDEDALDWLADRLEPARELERLCDAIAAELILPASVVDSVVDTGPVRAHHARELFDNSEASYHAVAVRLAQRIPGAGSVFMVDARSQRVAFAVNVGELGVWPWKDQQVPDTHVLRRLDVGEETTARSFWTTPWGQRADFYLDAKRLTNWILVVLAVNDLWDVVTFHAPTLGHGAVERPSVQLDCPCGYHGVVTGYPCVEGHPYCPSCKECACYYAEQKHVPCPNPDCFYVVPAADIHDGRCGFCG
jgi:hypothetical protein